MAGEAEGTVRCLDTQVWESYAELVPALARDIVAPYGVSVEARVHRGVPPVVNSPSAVSALHAAVDSMLGSDAATPTEQSLGGEDFAWYLTKTEGAMGRLGVRPPGQSTPFDLHQGTFDVDEEAISVGVRVLVAAALFGSGADTSSDPLTGVPNRLVRGMDHGVSSAEANGHDDA
jgi:amidohydrolase